MLRTKLLYLVGSLTLLTLFISTWGIQAQEATHEVLPERLEMLVYPPTDENSAELAAVLSQMAPADAQSGPPNFHLPATLLVYQNFDTGNWEILLNTAAQAKINLSNHPAADIHPRLNRGATHVLFASNRAGNFDLYLMKVDGSNLTQLTASAGDDVNPVWSPDGSKIAFESYRDGQPEIYVMNADGSNQTRLTNNPAFDGMPSWSPDGQMIAFSSRRIGDYRIYTMDATTGANQIQRSNEPVSIYPIWSPDGRTIMYSAAQYGAGSDYWLNGYRIVVHPNGEFSAESFPRITNVFSPYADIWVRGWDPSGEFVVFDVRHYERVDISPYQYYYRLTKLDIWSGSQFESIYYPPQQINQQDFLSINPDVHTTDLIPPVVTMEQQRYLPASASVVAPQWRYMEIGSGPGWTDFQHKKGNETWTNWYSQLNGSLTAFLHWDQPISIGDTFYFRVRNKDKHGNQGDWSEPTTTTFYNWYLSGRLFDNRGQAVGTIPVTFSKATINPVRTDANGRYTAQTIEAGSYQISLNDIQGQTILPATTLDRETRSSLTLAYLTPANNLLQNTHFEVDWHHWQNMSGTVTSRAGFTGEGAIMLGEAWQDCTNCVKSLHSFDWYNSFFSIWAQQAILLDDGLGNIHLLFPAMQTDTAPIRLYHTYLNPQGIWSAVQVTPLPSIDYTHFPLTTIDPQGNIHLLSRENFNAPTYYAHYKPQSGWQPVELVATDMGPYGLLSTKFFVDNLGHVHIFRQNNPYQHLTRMTNGTWSQQILPTEYGYETVQLDNKEIHLFHQVGGGTYAPVVATKHSVYRPATGAWQLLNTFNLPDGLLHQHVNIAFVEEEQAWYIDNHRYQSGEGWVQLPYNLPYRTDMIDLNAHLGAVEVTVREPYSYIQEVITNETAGDFIIGASLLDSQHNLHYVTGDMKYYGRHGRTALHDETHTLAQVVTIPADMPNPTVSLMYRTIRDLPGDDTQFEVQITNGALTTTHVLSPTAVVWEHAWFDASEWAGETVTLTLAAVQKAGDPLLRVDLDDVSLGSAAPDTWIALDIPQTAVPSEELTLTLHYGNFSPDLLAPTPTVTLTLPAGLTIHSISVTPTVQTAAQIIWQLGDLPADTSGTITLTATVNGNVPLMSTLTSTAELRTTIPEPSWGNNTRTADLFIGHRIHLPAILK